MWTRRAMRTLADIQAEHPETRYHGPDTVPGTFWVKTANHEWLLEGRMMDPAAKVLERLNRK